MQVGFDSLFLKHPVRVVRVLLNYYFCLFFSSCYFCLHIASILVLLVFPLKRTQKGSKKHESVQPVWSKKLEEENLLQNNSYSTTNNSFSQKQEITCRYQALKQWLRKYYDEYILYVFRNPFLAPFKGVCICLQRCLVRKECIT